MILIDASAWIDFFRRKGHPGAKQKVATYLELNSAAYTCPTLFELLAGAREQDAAFVRETLGLCSRVPFHEKLWEKAASYELALARKGLKVPRDDLFVAAVAADAGLPVFCRDAHFDILREKAIPSLRVIQAEP